MSKLIIEMELPRNCDECAANHYCAFCGITGSVFYGNTQMPNFMPDEQKLPDCPIKGELPDEHGDLIDRDALFLKYREQYDFIDEEDILNAEAIIAAERKDNGNI
jgi:hypothetical protein